jgi:hypothetical protein
MTQDRMSQQPPVPAGEAGTIGAASAVLDGIFGPGPAPDPAGVPAPDTS